MWAGQWAKAGLVLTLVSGCITTPRSRQVTDLYRDAGDGLRLTASVEQESAQQFDYHLPPSSYLLVWFPPLCFCDQWEIRCKQVLVYRGGDGKAVAREEREVRIVTTKTLFPLMATLDMVQMQDAIFHVVLKRVDEERRKAKRSIVQERPYADLLKACEQRTAADSKRGDALCPEEEDAPLVRALASLPYTVDRIEQPNTRGSKVLSRMQVRVGGMGGRRTAPTTTANEFIPFDDPNATFTVRIVRRFAAAKSGILLGTVDDTYVLHSEQMREGGVCQTLLK